MGACGRFDGERGHWKAAIVDPHDGEVTDIIDRPIATDCTTGPWQQGQHQSQTRSTPSRSGGLPNSRLTGSNPRVALV